MTTLPRRACRTFAICFAALVLNACGGGGSGDGCRSIDPAQPSCRISAAYVTPAQVAFVSAAPSNIAIKGTGGPGRQETSTLTFLVMDKSGAAVAGASVDFALFGTAVGAAGTGGLTVSPAQAKTDTKGMVTTTVLAGIVNTPVRVTATLTNSAPLVTTTSDELVISTGIPDQRGFSITPASYNSASACQSITVSLADHFRNPVPGGTAVSFTTESGVIGASCLTADKSGMCSVNFCPTGPLPLDGRITIMAYALGEESFNEDPTIPNGINRYDDGETFQDLCEPVRYDNAISDAEANFSANLPFYSAADITKASNQASLLCPTPPPNSTYIDTNGDGRFNATGDRIYNGVLRLDPVTGQTVANSKSPTVHVRRSIVLVVPNNSAEITLVSSPGIITLDKCVNGTTFANTAVNVDLAIRDTNKTIVGDNALPGNILPAGTKIEFLTSNGIVSAGALQTVANSNDPSQSAWTYRVTLRSDASQSSTPSLSCSNPVASGVLTVRVTTPIGTVTEKGFIVND